MYDINNWYWKTKEDEKIYSSASNSYIDVSDAAYQSWQKSYAPTSITKTDLGVLMNARIYDQIADLESRQSRAVREVALGIQGSITYLQQIDAAVVALRGKFMSGT